jgi:hypothetical protein
VSDVSDLSGEVSGNQLLESGEIKWQPRDYFDLTTPEKLRETICHDEAEEDHGTMAWAPKKKRPQQPKTHN